MTRERWIQWNFEAAKSPYLIVQEALLHAVVCANDLQNVPGELLVKLPGNESHAEGCKRNDSRNGD